jgi:hypothetical protein
MYGELSIADIKLRPPCQSCFEPKQRYGSEVPNICLRETNIIHLAPAPATSGHVKLPKTCIWSIADGSNSDGLSNTHVESLIIIFYRLILDFWCSRPLLARGEQIFQIILVSGLLRSFGPRSPRGPASQVHS